MAVKVRSKEFSIDEMTTGTVPDAWMATLTITTWRGFSTTALGSQRILATITYE